MSYGDLCGFPSAADPLYDSHEYPGDNVPRTVELARFNSHRELSRPEAGQRGRGRGGEQCGQCGPGVTFLY